jgi:hypothetical protein
MKRAAEKRSTTRQRVIVPAEADDETRGIPFITHWREGEKRGTNHWDVVTTGRHGEDCAIGSYYADKYLEYLRDSPTVGDQGLLLDIARDMHLDERPDGVQIGFWWRIGTHFEDLAQRLEAEGKEVQP